MTPPIEASGFHPNSDSQENFNSNLLFLKKGVTKVRILPAYSDAGKFFREIKEIPLYLNGKYSPVVSPATEDNPCPFVNEGQRLYNLGGEENVEKAKKFRPRSSFLFNAVVYETPDGPVDIEQCVKVLKCGVKVKRQIMDHDQDVAGGWGDITNLEEGFDLRITRTGTGRNDTEYTVKGVPQKTNVLDYLSENGFTQSLVPYNLDEMYAAKSYEELVPLLEQHKETFDPTVSITATPNVEPTEVLVEGQRIEAPPLPTE